MSQDYNQVRTAIKNILNCSAWDDGSLGPVLVRLVIYLKRANFLTVLITKNRHGMLRGRMTRNLELVDLAVLK